MVAQEIVPDDGSGVQEEASPCRHEPKCPPVMRPDGRLRLRYVPRRAGLDCDRPLRVVRVCSGVEFWACGNHRASKCAPCAFRYRRLVARKAEFGLTARPAWRGYFLTLNAPGERDHDRFVPAPHFRPGMKRPECHCHKGFSAAEWNPGAGRRWNHFRTLLRRLYPELEFHRATEVQERGAIHHHALVVTPEPLDVLALQRLARAAGYGCVMDLQLIPAGQEATKAGYLAKYVSKATDGRDGCPWFAEVLDETTGEVRRLHTAPTYRTHSSSRGWGLTMKAIREVLAAAAKAREARLRASAPEPLVQVLDDDSESPAGPGPP